jgi:hypothetical protein
VLKDVGEAEAEFNLRNEFEIREIRVETKAYSPI